MAILTFLGSAGAVPAIGHDNTYMVVEGAASTLLIDCGGSPLQKLQLAGIGPRSVRYLVFTHRHPDHMYGFPVLMLGLWLLGQQAALRVVGDRESMVTARSLLELFRPAEWPGFRRPEFQEVRLSGETELLDLPDVRVSACRTRHIVPSMALRLTDKATGGVVVYSADTAPCDAVVDLARGAKTLVHEASGDHEGHSTAAQAGAIAERAGVETLYLIHYPALEGQLKAMQVEAQKEFSGSVHMARDFGTIEF